MAAPGKYASAISGSRAARPFRRGALRHYPRLVSEDHGLDAVTKSELHQHPPDMGLDRCLRHDELGGDLGVGQSSRKQSQGLPLTDSEGLQPLRTVPTDGPWT